MSSYINVKLAILGETTITGKFSCKITVEQIKRWVFSNSPSLFSVGKEQFVLGVSPTEVLLDEQVILIDSHKTLRDAYQAGEIIEIHIYPKSIEQTQIEKLKNLYDTNSPLHSYDNAQIEGFLIKRGKSVQSWKRRYCILQNNFISYFKSKTDTTPIGAIPIQDCIYCARCNIVGRKNAFAVHTRTRTYYLIAEGVRETNDWIATINKCMEKLGIIPVDPKDQNGVTFNNIEKEGFLWKTGSQSKGWKRRYFRMEGRFMYYFKTAKSMTPLGCIPLQDVRFIEETDSGDKKKIYKFVLQTRHRNYNLYADDIEIFHEWKQAIQSNISANVYICDTSSIVPQKHVSIVIPEEYWEDKQKIEFSVLDNYKDVVDAFYRERSETVERIETRFGIVNTVACIDNEISIFRYHLICLLSSEANPSGKLQAELTHAPLSFTIPDQFPVFFFLQNSDLTGKSITCKRDQSVRDAVITVLKQLKRVPSALPPESGSYSDLGASDDLIESSMNYIVKISGTAEYVPNSFDIKLTQIRYIRESLKRNSKIKLSLIPQERSQPKKRLYRIGSQRRVLAVSKQIEAYCIFSAGNVPFMIKIFAIEQLNTEKYVVKNFEGLQTSFFVECFLAYGNQKIGTIMRTQKRPNPLFADTLSTSVLLASLPRETRLCITLYMRKNRDIPIAWVNTQIYDIEGKLRMGPYKLRMWKDEAATILGTTDNNPDISAPILIVEFINGALPIIHPTSFPEVSAPDDRDTPSDEEEIIFFRAIESDPLYFLSESEKRLIWSYRWYCLTTYPHSIAKVMLSVDWHNPAYVKEAHNLLRHWPIISPKYVLELLDANFSDSSVREFCLKCLNNLSNRELALYLLQLVQVIKYEPYHYSRLVAFLLKRAFQDFLVIGHPLFWHLRSELDINPNNLRFRLMIEAYMFASPAQLNQLFQQMDLVTDLLEISQEVKRAKTKIKRDKILQRELNKLNERIPAGLQLPLNPKWEVNGLIVEKCKWLDSFTVPLWLVFQNSDPQGDPIYIIFKSGDDLRQDVLTLQMLKIMDEFWKQEGSDLHLTPYECVSTGNEMGMIEVVLDSETTANIQKMAGGATAVFKSTPLTNWLVEHNRHESKQKRAIENFTMSLAGYCVATYVLGIGDRHNDNIMVTRGGHLFHIDFAHFLGNVMKFHGFKRERAPFVLTPDFVNVIGGKDSQGWFRFVDICNNAFNTIRKYARIFISLFMMMLSTGIPQLTSQEDLDYLTESFCMGKDDNEAKQIFTGLINESLSTKATQLNFAIHILAHPD